MLPPRISCVFTRSNQNDYAQIAIHGAVNTLRNVVPKTDRFNQPSNVTSTKNGIAILIVNPDCFFANRLKKLPTRLRVYVLYSDFSGKQRVAKFPTSIRNVILSGFSQFRRIKATARNSVSIALRHPNYSCNEYFPTKTEFL